MPGAYRPLQRLYEAPTGIRGNSHQEKEKESMKRKRTYIWAYLDGKKLIEVIQAALDNNMMVEDMKQLLIEENPGHEVTFKVVKA
jgi:hypothetical protein